MVIGDQLDRLLGDIRLDLLDATGKPASSLVVPALVTIFQFAERLPDRRAADVLRGRLDWKYALHLSPDYPGLEPWVLCEFRQSLFEDSAAQQVFQVVLDRLSESGLVRYGDEGRPGAPEVLSAVCRLSRLERLADGMRAVLESLAAHKPEWLRAVARPHWYERYNRTLPTSPLPQVREEQESLAVAIGADALYLLDKIPPANGTFMLPEVQALWKIWHRQFNQSPHEIKWRLPYCATCNGLNGLSKDNAIPA